MTELDNFRADRALYPRDAWRTEPSLWAVAIYRFGRHAQTLGGIRGRIARRVYKPLHLFSCAVLSIEIPTSVTIGPGFRIYHQGTITINGRTTIGMRCRLRQGVTIGVRERDGGVPAIGDDVFIGSSAQILGAVIVGDRAKIGAGAVVLKDVPADATAVGVPARIIPGN